MNTEPGTPAPARQPRRTGRSLKDKQLVITALAYHIKTASADEKDTVGYCEWRGALAALLWDRRDIAIFELVDPNEMDNPIDRRAAEKLLAFFDAHVDAEASKYNPASRSRRKVEQKMIEERRQAAVAEDFDEQDAEPPPAPPPQSLPARSGPRPAVAVSAKRPAVSAHPKQIMRKAGVGEASTEGISTSLGGM